MIEPYPGPSAWCPPCGGIRHRYEIAASTIEQASGHLIKAASWLSSLDLPVRLIRPSPRKAPLQGFNDEVLDLDHEDVSRRECGDRHPRP